MAIQFPRAPLVAAGDKVASKDLAGLAAAINARLTSGLGDPTFRLRYFWLGLFRNIRNPGASGFLYPPTAEFFERYQALDESVPWPVTSPGDPEGINVSNPVGAFLYGVDGRVNDEASALNTVPLALPDGTQPTTPSEIWALGKLQRGAWDPTTGGTGAPALDAARYFQTVRWPWWQPYQKSYGDWVPGPDEQLPACDDPETESPNNYPAPRNLVVFFTALAEGVDTSELSGTITTNGDGMSVCTYDGTCVPGTNITPSTKYDTHVAGIAEDDINYYVVLWDGTVDILKREEWIQGPYSGTARLTHTDGQQLQRGMHAFAREFRGTSQNGWPNGTPAHWNRDAFDAERFLTTQYHLAPQRGSEAMGGLTADYRGAYFAGNQLPGATATVIGGGSTFTPHEDCTTTACLITTTGLAKATEMNVLEGGEILSRLTLTPSDGVAEGIVTFPDNADPQSLSWELPSGAVVTRIDIEVNELMTYKPRVWDMFLVTRLGGVSE